jgi:hypothetical protein
MKKKLLILSSSLVLALLFFVFTGKAVSFADLTFTSFTTGVKAIDFKWQSAYTIVGTLPDKSTVKFVDKNGAYDYYTGGTGEYTSDKPACASSHAIINATPGGTGASTSAGGQFRAQWLLGGAGTGNGGCQPETTTIINIGDGNNSKYTYEFSGTSIVNMNGGNKFNQDKNISPAGDVYSLVGTACSSIIVYKNGTATFYPISSTPARTGTGRGGVSVQGKSNIPYSPSCYLDDKGYGQIGYTSGTPTNTNDNGGFVIPVLGTPGSSPSVPIPTSSGSATSGGSTTSSVDCLSSGGPLSWITCAVFDGISGLESTLEDEVASLLKVTPINFSTTCSQNDNSGCIFNVWANFRIYGNLFLIIALLIAVLVEAIGGGMVANYTIKKMIPRILVAVILINLSIYVVAIMIDVFNILGTGVYDLIKQPFQAAGAWHIMVGGGTGILTTLAGGGAATLLAIGIIGDGIGFLLMAIAVPAILAVIGVLITIVIRQGLIIFLAITAPIAFALYCLPNTEQYFKKWWDLLIKTLVVYPVVMLVIAIANVTAVVFGSLSNGGSWNQILGIIAGIIPLFLIPFAFKISGGVIAQVSGMTKKGADWANKSLRGNPNDPNSRYNKAREKAQAGRNRQGTSIGMLNARRKGGRVGMAERQRVMGEAYGAKVASSSEVFQANLQNDAVMDCVADRDGFQRRINAATGAEKEQLIAAQSIAETIPKTAAFQAAAVMQKSVTGRSYANVKDISDGYGGTLVGGEAQNRAMVNDAMLGIKDVSVDRQGNYQGTGASAARNRLNAMKANMDASGNSHLGNSGEGEAYNPITATSKKKLEQLAEQPNAVQALAEHAAKQANSGRQAGVEEAAKIRQELSNIANGPGSGIAKEAAAQGVQRIDSTTVSYQAMPNGFIGPGTPLSTPVSFSSYTSTSPVMGQNGVLIAPSGGGAQYAQNGVAQARDFIQKVDQI